MQSKSIAFLLLLMIASVAAADAVEDSDQPVEIANLAQHVEAMDSSGFHLTLEGGWMWGPVSGHLQTPSGGRPGTTSPNRPTLSELGIEHASIFDAEIRPGIGKNEIYLGSQWVRMQKRRVTLDEDLTSQGNFFPAGTIVEADVKMDWYRLGWRYLIQRGDEPGAFLPVDIHSRLGAALLDFRYKLDSGGPAEVDRGYKKVAPQLGIDMEWHATKKFSIAGELTSTVPFSSMPLIITADVVAKYDFIEKGGCTLSGFIGAGYEKISFHDSQQVNNDINADFGPMIKVGLELKF